MLKDWKNIEVTPGTHCDRRLPKPLDKNTLKVRPATIAQSFCAAGRRLGAEGANLQRDHRTAPWKQLFLKEPAYVLSEILNFNAEDAAHQFRAQIENDPAGALLQIGEFSHAMIDWIGRLKQQMPDVFSKQLQQLNAQGALEIRLANMAQGSASKVLSAVRADSPDFRKAGDSNALIDARTMETELRSTHALLRNSVLALKPAAQLAFDTRLTSGKMDPALGLLVAELQTAALVDTQINDFVDRHIKFYYGDIIGQHPAPATRQNVLLQMPPSPRSVYLPKGATLEARDANDVVEEFATLAPAHIGPARVASIAVLTYDTDVQISLNAALAGITGVRAARYPAGPRQDKGRVFSSSSETSADMGLDITSPMLALAEGVRTIELTFNMMRSANLDAASVPQKPGTRRVRQNINDPDPEVVLALRSDPDLIQALDLARLGTSVEAIATTVDELARSRQVTTSLALIYEVLVYEGLGDDDQTLHRLRVLLGRMVTLSLIERAPFAAGDYWTALNAKIDAYREQLSGQVQGVDATTDGQESRRSMIFEAFERNKDGSFVYSPGDMFQKLLGDAFSVHLSTTDGLQTATLMQIVQNTSGDDGGMTVRLMLDDSFPAVAAADPASAPTLLLRYAANARTCPMSFCAKDVIGVNSSRVIANFFISCSLL